MAPETTLEPVDWAFIIGYCLITFGVALIFSRRAGKSIEEFFVAGRSLPWWLAGTSIVATTFAADTPLAVSGFIRKYGISHNWLWWNALMGGMLCVFFYARLWRRAALTTDVEFIELRYEGKSASLLRGFLAVYSGVLTNCITMGWVMMAMAKLLKVMLGWDALISLFVLVCIALVYTILSGLWGVVVTDLFQFVIAMVGSISLAVIVMWKIGGPTQMLEQIHALPGIDPNVAKMIPPLSTDTSESRLALTTFVILVSALWWTGGQGGGILVQRLFATKNERHALLAVLWFNFTHYVLRPWPWILVGLASLVFIPVTDPNEDSEAVYAMMMVRFLPTGLRGLMVASFLAAFMSTMDSHLNWGSSYLVNDLYRRFIRKNAPARHYVLAARLACLIIVVLAALTAWQMNSIENAWKYLMVLTSGMGVLMLLRWFWWRVNALAEISALVSSFLIANGFLWAKITTYLAGKAGITIPESWTAGIDYFYSSDLFAVRGLVVIVVCTIIWIVVALLTSPVSRTHLEVFYRLVRPGGWWGPIARGCPDVKSVGGTTSRWMAWLLGVVCLYSLLFGVGHLCLGRKALGFGLLLLGVGAGMCLVRQVKRLLD